MGQLAWWAGTLVSTWLVLYVIGYSLDAWSTTNGPQKFASVVTAIFGVFFALLTLLTAIEDCTTQYYTARTGRLVAVKNKDGTEGTFIFGSGSFGQSTKYRVYVENGGEVFQREFDGRSTGIAEDAQPNDAYVETKYSVKREGNSWARRYMNPCCGPRPIEEGNTLHVPKGTVIQQFKVE